MKKIDLTGQKFGRLTVIDESEPKIESGKPVRMWNCLCECGNIKAISQINLTRGHTTSCGCYLDEVRKNRPHMDLTGNKYNHWTVLYESEPKYDSAGHKIRIWHCQCDCEFKTEQDMPQRYFLYGGSKQCKKCSKKNIPNYKNRKQNEYDLSGEYGIGYDSKGKKFIFDLEDYDLIKDYCWVVNNNGYVVASNRNSKGQIKLHRLILGLLDSENPYMIVPDHIGGKNTRFDNRKCNLRIATNSDNSKNIGVRSDSTSKVTGVSFNKEKQLWRAYINIDYKQIYLGYFESFDNAVQARKEAEEKYFGEFSYENSSKIAEHYKIN